MSSVASLNYSWKEVEVVVDVKMTGRLKVPVAPEEYVLSAGSIIQNTIVVGE